MLENMELATECKKLQVDIAHWHSWSESRKKAHVEKFRIYKTTLSKAYENPTNLRGSLDSCQETERMTILILSLTILVKLRKNVKTLSSLPIRFMKSPSSI